MAHTNSMIKMSACKPPGIITHLSGFRRGPVGLPGCVTRPVSPKLWQSNPDLESERNKTKYNNVSA